MPHNDVPDILEAAVVVMPVPVGVSVSVGVSLFLMMFMRVPVMRQVMVPLVMAVGLAMRMGVKMGVKAFFFLAIYRDPHMGSGDTALFHGLRLKADTGYPCGLQVPKEGLPVRQCARPGDLFSFMLCAGIFRQRRNTLPRCQASSGFCSETYLFLLGTSRALPPM